MPQYLITAHDGTDSDVPSRRMHTRPAHLDMARSLKQHKHFIIGGAILNDQSEMKGSVMIVEFDNEAALQEWMDIEPYIINNVWQDITVSLFKVADV